MNKVIFLLLLVPFALFAADPERLPSFSYDYKKLSLESGCFFSEPVIFESPKKEGKVSVELLPPPVQQPRQEYRLQGAAELDIKEVSSIRGVAPKFVYRSERFLKGRFIGKFYSSQNHYFYLGGIKSLWWRADPRDVGVFAGSGMDF